MKKKAFKAESKRLLDLMINSIYTHKEIFLREIISNASDAIDKLCYLSLTDDKVGLNRDQFEIKLSIDKERRLLTVSDNGIGMSQEELENNLGVIASSGSLKFRQEVAGDEIGRGRRADAAQHNALLHGPEPAVRHSGALLVRAAALLGLGGRRFAVPHCRVPAHLGTCGRFSVRYSAKTLNFWLVCTKASNIIRALFTIL